ncbi:hypothetical protein ACFPRL_04825 [Pseudoclavibacter helvolus]
MSAIHRLCGRSNRQRGSENSIRARMLMRSRHRPRLRIRRRHLRVESKIRLFPHKRVCAQQIAHPMRALDSLVQSNDFSDAQRGIGSRGRHPMTDLAERRIRLIELAKPSRYTKSTMR